MHRQVKFGINPENELYFRQKHGTRDGPMRRVETFDVLIVDKRHHPDLF
jgi:hypothetical protein